MFGRFFLIFSSDKHGILPGDSGSPAFFNYEGKNVIVGVASQAPKFNDKRVLGAYLNVANPEVFKWLNINLKKLESK